MEYSNREIEYIKALNWDKGWRWGLVVASILWIGTIVVVMVFFS